eukprot:3890593-Amphidinium_carterae.1
MMCVACTLATMQGLSTGYSDCIEGHEEESSSSLWQSLQECGSDGSPGGLAPLRQINSASSSETDREESSSPFSHATLTCIIWD